MGTTIADRLSYLARLVSLLLLVFLASCQHAPTYAPVMDITRDEPIPASGRYKVTTGDTLYSIAWRYGLDYHDLADYNHLDSSFRVYKGQIIRLNKPVESSPTVKVITRVEKPIPTSKPQKINKALYSAKRWVRPAAGAIVTPYSRKHKGVNISGRYGEPVHAASGGQVVYAGDGLRGYGNLVIIKHNSHYLSAYAYNSKLMVKTGDWVKTGQVIAKMGRDDSNRVMLHFEVRRNGKPVNPLSIHSIKG